VEPERLIRLDSGKNLGKLDAMVTDVDAISKAKTLERREQSLIMSKKKMKTTPNCDSAIAMTKPQENVQPQASNSADTSTLINLLANKEDHARYQDEKWMENSRVSKNQAAILTLVQALGPNIETKTDTLKLLLEAYKHA
jgi:hypothetical protein